MGSCVAWACRSALLYVHPPGPNPHTQLDVVHNTLTLTLPQLAGAIFQNAMNSALSESGLPTGIARDSERFIFVLQAMPEEDPRKATLLACYSEGFRKVFIAMTVISASALLASSAIRKFGMDAALPVSMGPRTRP